MHTLKVLSKLFALIFCIFMLYGCGSDSDKGELSMRFVPVMTDSQPEVQLEPQPESELEPSNISLSLDKLDLEHFAGTSTIQIKTDCDWKIGFGESSNTKDIKKAVNTIDWIKAEPSSGTGDCEVTLTFEDNRILTEDRTCEIFVISESGNAISASIKQEGITYDNAKEGDKVIFGRWPQSYDAYNLGGIDNFPDSYEPLTWVVDSKKNNEIYMTTEKIIAYLPISTPDSFINSELRTFLKDIFYETAFNDNVEKSIMGYFDDPQIDSPVSLFSSTVPYFSTNESRRCKITDYVRLWYNLVHDDYGYLEYWCDYDFGILV